MVSPFLVVSDDCHRKVRAALRKKSEKWGWRTARKAHYLGPERESSRFLSDGAEIVGGLPVAKMAGRWRINPTLIGHAIFPGHCKNVGGALEFVR
ncbi:hypothetical protein [Paraburkholderia sp. Ac-20347]|uniref:hypothetical protein n=1 Tax=Paraburkholderia sp. Ac-20347 TaxID=2703892 RepID=UPI0019809C84|nr:hypothetical protein [Paraburkholderia sp. Ac-20347]MBN3813976.1 hypothetical protein [Paraburkholderia sp. Ac-20347]